jgi:hypothetical protein
VSICHAKEVNNEVEEYTQVLDEAQEIINKHGADHNIVIGGDFNAQLFSGHPDKQDRWLISFCEDLKTSSCLMGIIQDAQHT